MTGPAMRSTPVTGPGSASDTSYVSTPAASYASTASTPATSYAPSPSTPAASYAASYASPHASTPAGAGAVLHTDDYVSGEQYRYALTNFVRTSIKEIYPLTFLPIPHVDAYSYSLRPSHIRRSRNSGPSSKSRIGRSH